MIDADGFRANVGIVICNKMGQVFWARRYGQHSWQFPQGGIDEGETAEQAMYRELHEEVGLTKKDVDVLKTGHPEFDDWRWVSYWYPIRNVVSFKRDVYRKVMKEFAGVAMPAVQRPPQNTSNKRHRKRRRNG